MKIMFIMMCTLTITIKFSFGNFDQLPKLKMLKLGLELDTELIQGEFSCTNCKGQFLTDFDSIYELQFFVIIQWNSERSQNTSGVPN